MKNRLNCFMDPPDKLVEAVKEKIGLELAKQARIRKLRNISLAGLGAVLIVLILLIVKAHAAVNPPENLWMGLVAEDTSGNINTYRIIASVVRNRLNRGMDTGLVALKRKNLEHFVQREMDYARSKDIELYTETTKAIDEVFEGKKDYASGATHYEHTGVYPTPKWAKSMKVVKVVYKGTEDEITLWK